MLTYGNRIINFLVTIIYAFGYHADLFGFAYLPGIESGEEQPSHSHCAGLCLHIIAVPSSVLLILSTRQHEFCPNMIDSYLCAGSLSVGQIGP